MNTPDTTGKSPADISAEFPAIFALVNRLSSALDSSINGKDRSVLVTELSQLTFSDIPEPERTLVTELLKRTITTLDQA
ncbi:hypothetical protein NE897_10870 [Yersinia ruckeri]|uniref:Uncharacterized protein n=1 Tax=Yersinia ruckeri TaxID=29486 RepID=A0A085UA08_YERRU|nr:hypothetical protein [Yersinia ruckeri]AKA36948.1 hypothetical protein UGYR_00150 [Yersinia ruckeri]ARZ01415.1 hypothetical protein QMA0440_02082 [Yersinia ruckeri]AUQ43402.1 hypothetical protein NJ56_16660 [Yersinia ruckeri]EEP99752.1 hypothetical protein yruck0001_17610 [Yersinia ruckeri ATCC 29473]EKN3345088.1 hypothetical protein [Yersinia ruckeri]